MKRICIVGTSGSGKTTFAQKLAKQLGYPCYELDQLYWKPDWQGSSNEELCASISDAMETDTWVIDGNYPQTMAMRWEQADTIIWLDYSFARILFQVVRRSIIRCIDRTELWPGTGNRESPKLSFLSKKSVIWWSITHVRSNRIRYRSQMSDPHYAHLHFVRVRNPKEAAELLNDPLN